jgi:hypothetical protein
MSESIEASTHGAYEGRAKDALSALRTARTSRACPAVLRGWDEERGGGERRTITKDGERGDRAERELVDELNRTMNRRSFRMLRKTAQGP